MRTLTRLNSSQLRSVAMATGLERGVSAMSRRIWRRLLSVMGMSVATLSSVASTSFTTSRWSRMLNCGRLDAISMPLRSMMRPRGGGGETKVELVGAGQRLIARRLHHLKLGQPGAQRQDADAGEPAQQEGAAVKHRLALVDVVEIDVGFSAHGLLLTRIGFRRLRRRRSGAAPEGKEPGSREVAIGRSADRARCGRAAWCRDRRR